MVTMQAMIRLAKSVPSMIAVRQCSISSDFFVMLKIVSNELSEVSVSAVEGMMKIYAVISIRPSSSISESVRLSDSFKTSGSLTSKPSEFLTL